MSEKGAKSGALLLKVLMDVELSIWLRIVAIHWSSRKNSRLRVKNNKKFSTNSFKSWNLQEVNLSKSNLKFYREKVTHLSVAGATILCLKEMWNYQISLKTIAVLGIAKKCKFFVSKAGSFSLSERGFLP